MDLTWLFTTVNELVAFKNSVISQSKRILQLPPATVGVKWIAVQNETSLETEKFNLSDVLGGVFALTDGMIQFGDITRVDDTFTFGIGFRGRINGVIYENPAEVDLTIDGAGAGNHRIDIAVLDDNNDIYIIQGFEVPLANTVEQPTPEPNTLFISSFLVEESDISAPIYDGSFLFLEKVRIRKGFGNVDTSINEAGDIFQFGFVRIEDGVKCFADFAIYTGGDINNNNNYTDMTIKEISFTPSTEEFGPDIGSDFG